jgi:two-component sensor histidine kinase
MGYSKASPALGKIIPERGEMDDYEVDHDFPDIGQRNGVGKPDGVFAQPKSGLGTGIVKALAKHLDAQVETVSDSQGTTVSITHATFSGKTKTRLHSESLNA